MAKLPTKPRSAPSCPRTDRLGTGAICTWKPKRLCPKAHQRLGLEPPEKLIAWASSIPGASSLQAVRLGLLHAVMAVLDGVLLCLLEPYIGHVDVNQVLTKGQEVIKLVFMVFKKNVCKVDTVTQLQRSGPSLRCPHTSMHPLLNWPGGPRLKHGPSPSKHEDLGSA